MRRGVKQFLLLQAVVLAGVSSGALAKENPSLPMPPPMAISQSVSTGPGRPVTITLTLGGRIVEPVEFLIRRPPQRGELGEVRRTGRNTATVVYTPFQGSGAGGDSFTFAAQSFDSPVSAAARVRIAINEELPLLTFAQSLDFGQVFLGQRVVRQWVLRNEGGGTATGKIAPPSPWTVEGAAYQIAGGSKAVFNVVFAPAGEKNYSGEFRVGPDLTVALTGSGVAPITWPAGGIVVDAAGRQEKRFSFELSNRTPDPRQVAIGWPDFVKGPDSIAIPAGGNATVEAGFSCDQTFSFDGQIAVRSEGFEGAIPLKVPAVPARLAVSPSAALDIGTVKSGRSASGRFTIRNLGGIDTRLKITASPEINIVPNPANIILSPGREHAFDAQIEATKGGAYQGKISVFSDSGDPVELAIKATFPDQQPGAPPTPGPAVPVATLLPAGPASPSEGDLPLPASQVPPVDAVSLLAATPHEIEVAWKVPSPEAKSFRIERRQIAPGDSSEIRYQWVPWTEARIQIRGNAAFARFERMPANGVWLFRIIAVDSSGRPLSRSMPFRIFTLPEPQHRVPWWAIAILSAGLLWLVIRAVSRKNRKRSEADGERIARLGKC